MPTQADILIPDLGDFADVEVIEVLVAPGDVIAVEDPLVTLETDKAAMEVPATAAGAILSVALKVGDKVNAGDLVATVDAGTSAQDGAGDDRGGETEATVVLDPKKQREILAAAKPATASESASQADATHRTQLVVLGAGPGGYTAAFRAADLGMQVTLVERWPMLGGVCLNVGCIPSKALLHAANVIEEAKAMGAHGVHFGEPQIDVPALRNWKNKVVERLTGGLSQLAKQRKVTVLHGAAKFTSANSIALDNGDTLAFEKCIIAVGSEPAALPGVPDDPRIVDSTGALELDPLPDRMLVVGGGIIGLEMACIYSALGSKVSVVELTDSLMPGTDPDLVRPFLKIVKQRYEAIMPGTKVSSMQATKAGIEVSFEGKAAPDTDTFDKVLVSIGRRANGNEIDCHKAGVTVTERGIIPVNKRMQTNVGHIFAIGDVVGDPMLAHKATHEAKVAAEVAAGEKSAFDARTIPSVAYTDPEIAWVGLTETQAKANGVAFEKAQFPWAASGRALSLGRDEGFTKLLFEKASGRILGGGIVGPNAGDLIAEVGLAIEMGADAADISLTIHPHPTLSETVAFAAEAFEGTLTDLYIPKKR